MSAKGLDALIVVANAQYEQKGFARYLSNYNNRMYGTLVIFPLEGEPKFIVPSPFQEYWSKRMAWIRDVEISPVFGEGLVKNLKAMGLANGKLGLISHKIIPADTYMYLIENCPDAAIVDATELLEEARMIKSEKEQQLARTAARLADLSLETAAKLLKAGIPELEVMAEVDRQLIANGAEHINHLFRANPDDLFPSIPTDRLIQKGDAVIVNTEVSGPEGYWVQTLRTSFIGSPKKNLARMYDTAMEIRSRTVEELYPGKKVSEIVDNLRKIIIDAGYDATPNFGHAMGLDIVEHPFMRVGNDTVLASGMVITIHPMVVSQADNASVVLGDTYLLSDSGPELLTKFDPLAMKILD